MPENQSNGKLLDTTTYDVFMSVCSMGSIAIVAWLFFADPDTEQSKLLNYFDDLFCLVFFIDYLRQLVKAPHKLRYIFGWGLFDLASSIPAVGPLRLLRLARIVRVVRALRSFRILTQVFRSDRVGAAIVSSMTLTLAGIILACMGVLYYEGQTTGANIKTADDVMWWAVVTTSTVGYGDFYPVTGPGRLLAALVMVLGIGLFATLAAAIASRMTSMTSLAHPKSIEHRIHELQQQNHELLKKLESKL